ncbi:type VI secretion system protein TssL [Enterobacteriaceae bacterium 4M9]|nr:type VI secretion system protein TssL [Enterobacteriaceae bacterium 4M9]
MNSEEDFVALSLAQNGEGYSQEEGHFLFDEPDKPLTEHAAESHEGEPGYMATAPDIRYDAGMLRGESIQQRVLRVRASDMPLLEAAQPLLLALSQMPETVNRSEQAALLKEGLRNEISLFTLVCDETDISWKKMAIVRYCLCTALDEAAHTRAWGLTYGWSQSNLLNHFEGDNDGGNKFFLLIGRLSMNPQEYADVLDILLKILNLGFEGRYSIIDDGERQLTRIRQRLLALLQNGRDCAPQALSPHANVTRETQRRKSGFIPARVSVLITGLLVAGCFLTYKYWLAIPENRLSAELIGLQQHPAQQAPARLRLSVLLRDEIARNKVSVDETDRDSKVTFSGDYMFAVGAIDVRADIVPMIKRVAEEITRVRGQVNIVGFTDNTPIHTRTIPDNQALSVRRAQRVAALLNQFGVPESSVRFEGKGALEPLATNETPEGRAQNRRVEISVKY